MKYLKVEATPHWGLYINYHAFTKSRPALKTIPPTTLIGALAQPIALKNNWAENSESNSSAEKIRPLFKGIYLSQNLPLIEYNDLSKIFSYDVDEKQIRTDAAAVSKIYRGKGSADDRVKIVYLFEEQEARKLFGVGWEEMLLEAAWSITRLGARESIVSVDKVTLGDVDLLNQKTAQTVYYFPYYMQSSVQGSYLVANVVDWRKTSIGEYLGKPTVNLIVPYDDERKRVSPLRVNLMDEIVYRVGDEELIPW
ncbi:MAG: type I-A CRISPR-associated protein Cas5a [Candidatus Caldarchaeum sp.]|nr:type I-A CRISPR-associated protein Cas5a [Candidatus Caldarchaeales archaeon]